MRAHSWLLLVTQTFALPCICTSLGRQQAQQHVLQSAASITPEPGNSTANLIFASLAYFHNGWRASSRPNGHSLVVVKVPIGTALWYGAVNQSQPLYGEWASFFPALAEGPVMIPNKRPIYLNKYFVQKPLRLLSFDGLSGAGAEEGESGN